MLQHIFAAPITFVASPITFVASSITFVASPITFIAMVIFLIITAIAFIARVPPRAYIGANDQSLNVRQVGDGPRVFLIPGLGNGIESYNWNLSTPTQQQKSKLTDPKYASSLQDRIAALGYNVICADPPGYGSNDAFPIDFDKYIGAIHEFAPRIIVGHSVGARVAQYYGETYKIPYIMIDPTPDYVLENIKYTKHIDEPTPKNINTHLFLEMMRGAALNKPWRPEALIYSVDDDDEGRVKKDEYFNAIDVPRQRIENATHWVHITNPDVIIVAIEKINVTGGDM